MSIIAGGKDSILNVCSHHKMRTTAPWPSGYKKVRESGGVLIAFREFGKTAGHKITFPDLSLIQCPWIFVTTKKKNKKSFDWFYVMIGQLRTKSYAPTSNTALFKMVVRYNLFEPADDCRQGTLA